MQWLAQISVKRPVFASVLILSLVVVGVFAYFRLGVDLFPKVDFPIITVTTRQAGAAPDRGFRGGLRAAAGEAPTRRA